MVRLSILALHGIGSSEALSWQRATGWGEGRRAVGCGIPRGGNRLAPDFVEALVSGEGQS